MRKTAAFIFTVVFLWAAVALADCGCGTACSAGDCARATKVIVDHHKKYVGEINQDISSAFVEDRKWLYDTFFLKMILPALMKMSEQLTAVAAQQMQAVGIMTDADSQLSYQRAMQLGQSIAQKQYAPSENVCVIGTGVRALAASEGVSDVTAQILNARQMARDLRKYGAVGADGRKDQDLSERWAKFKKVYCHPKDNGTQINVANTGLSAVCEPANNQIKRPNRDIDFTGLIDEPRTLSLKNDMVGPVAPDASAIDYSSDDFQDVLALSNNLYGHNILKRVDEEILRNEKKQHLYLDLHALAAQRAVAENSYNSIVSLKAGGTTGPTSPNNSWKFLSAVVREFGVSDSDITRIIGSDPSQYAQLEILSKRIFQTPEFYANLYDSPTNVKRKSVALRAIERMLDQAIYESQLRQEMLTSVLLSSRLDKQEKAAQESLGGSKG